jgi:hypothetical protein
MDATIGSTTDPDTSVRTELDSLKSTNDALRQRLEQLENAVMGVVASPAQAISNAASELHTDADSLRPFSTPEVTSPPIESDVAWLRRDPSGVGAGYTNMLLALISENTQTNSFSWPLYVELRGTSSSSATQTTSQSVGATVRAYNSSIGSPWLAAFHSEPHHGENWEGKTSNANGTTIGYNMELSRLTSYGTAIGIELQNTVNFSANGDIGLNIVSTGSNKGWGSGIYFQGGAGAGNVAINMEAQYNLGLDLGPNSMRMNAGEKVILEHYGTAWLSYNPTTGNIELYKNSKLVASF